MYKRLQEEEGLEKVGCENWSIEQWWVYILWDFKTARDTQENRWNTQHSTKNEVFH